MKTSIIIVGWRVEAGANSCISGWRTSQCFLVAYSRIQRVQQKYLNWMKMEYLLKNLLLKLFGYSLPFTKWNFAWFSRWWRTPFRPGRPWTELIARVLWSKTIVNKRLTNLKSWFRFGKLMFICLRSSMSFDFIGSLSPK